MPKTKHNLTGTNIYHLWSSIKARCFNKNNALYHDYGGRGITLYPAWRKDLVAFYTYVKTLPDYSKIGLSLDRINNDGNYEPGNLRWATSSQQALNRRPSSRANKTGHTNIRERSSATLKFSVSINRGGIRYSLGSFKTIEEAISVRDTFIKR